MVKKLADVRARSLPSLGGLGYQRSLLMTGEMQMLTAPACKKGKAG